MSEEILKVLEKLKDENNYQRDCNDGSCFIELFVNEIYILCKFMEDLQQKVEQLENIRKEAIEELSYMSTDAYVEDYDIREKHYNLLMSILNKGNDKE